MPDGTGLPPGSGTAAQGAPIYAQKCAACHGESGKGGTAAALVGGQPVSNAIETTKTIANFWPYASTLFDFTRRAMPWNKPRTLTNDEVYALTAYILALNKIIGESDVMNAQTLPKVQMPASSATASAGWEPRRCASESGQATVLLICPRSVRGSCAPDPRMRCGGGDVGQRLQGRPASPLTQARLLERRRCGPLGRCS